MNSINQNVTVIEWTNVQNFYNRKRATALVALDKATIEVDLDKDTDGTIAAIMGEEAKRLIAAYTVLTGTDVAPALLWDDKVIAEREAELKAKRDAEAAERAAKEAAVERANISALNVIVQGDLLPMVRKLERDIVLEVRDLHCIRARLGISCVVVRRAAGYWSLVPTYRFNSYLNKIVNNRDGKRTTNLKNPALWEAVVEQLREQREKLAEKSRAEALRAAIEVVTPKLETAGWSVDDEKAYTSVTTETGCVGRTVYFGLVDGQLVITRSVVTNECKHETPMTIDELLK